MVIIVNPAQDTVSTPEIRTPAWTRTGEISTNFSFSQGRESKEGRWLSVTTELSEAFSFDLTIHHLSARRII